MSSTAPSPRACLPLAWVQILFVLLLPFLWFFHRLPDSKDIVHLTWHPAWLILPLGAGAARFILRDKAKEEGRDVGDPGRFERFVSNMTLAVFVPFFLFWAAEGLLKLKGYQRELAPVIFETPEIGEGKELNRNALAHPVFLFTFKPGSTYNRVPINSLGYREREVDPVKAPGTKRVICFGDSITAQGRPNYSGILHALLQEDPPDDTPWEAFNMGVYGYSSRQGLAVFREQGKALKPDVITVYFGPNDRNLYTVTDKQRMAKVQSGLGAHFSRNFREKRIGQLIIGTATDIAMAKVDKREGMGDKVLRVPPEDYRHVLRQFVLEAREIGAECILMTAARRELSPGLLSEGHAVSLEAVTERHDAYNEIVREVAEELDAPLLDVAAELSGPEFDHFFADDGVHFDSYATEHVRKPKHQPGLEWIASRLHQVLKEDVVQEMP